jgi:hypothetical protein
LCRAPVDARMSAAEIPRFGVLASILVLLVQILV